MPKNILCAVDGSHASDRAAACAVELASATGAGLTFVHVNTVAQDRVSKIWYWDETLLSAVNDQIQAQLAASQKIAKDRRK
jgi:nucleotide-binding universal stress UspA family protein